MYPLWEDHKEGLKTWKMFLEVKSLCHRTGFQSVWLALAWGSQPSPCIRNRCPFVPVALQERGSSPAGVRDSSMPSFLNFVSFWVLSKTVLLAPTWDLVAGVFPDVTQKGQLCFGLNISHFVLIFSKRFKLTSFKKTPALRKKSVGTMWHQPSDISTSILFSAPSCWTFA